MTTTSEFATARESACYSWESSKTYRNGPGVSRSLFGGFVGTVAVTMMMYAAAPMMLGYPMDVAKMLGTFLGDNWWAGMIMHFVNGTVVFPLIYVFLLYRVLRGSPTVKGITWGIVLWLTAQIVVMPMMGAGFFSGSAMVAMASLIGHVAYGSLLGWFAGSSE